MSGRRHPRAPSIALSLAAAALVAGAGAAHAQPRLPVPPLPPAPPVVHPPLPPAPPVPIPPPPPVVVETPPAAAPGYYPAADAPPPPPPAAQPPPPPPAEPPAVINGWQPDDPIPEGYRKVSKPNAGYLGIGIGMFSAGWVSAIVAGAVETDDASKATKPGALKPSAWVPMFFPLAGPFITIITAKQGTESPAGLGLLLCDGIFQAASVLGILVGSMRWTHKLVRVGGLEATVDVTPAAAPGFAGVQTIGHF